MVFDRGGEREALLVDLGGTRRRDPGLPHERVALVAEHQTVVLHTVPSRPLLGEGVLHLEVIGQVAVCVDPHLKLGRLVPVVGDGVGCSASTRSNRADSSPKNASVTDGVPGPPRRVKP